MTILVAGPSGAGVSGLVAVLRKRMQGHVVVELGEQKSGEFPAAVVFVVSSVAPMTPSDADLIDRAGGYADLVVGAVSKIDAHRQWRDVLAANRALLADRATRYRDVPWTGVSAAPELGESNVDELIAILADGLVDSGLAERNRLRVNAVRAQKLRERRADVVRARRASALKVRSEVQQARVRLTFLVRKRCAHLVAGLRLSAVDVSRGDLVAFEERVRAAAEEFVAEVDAEIARELGHPLGGPPSPPEIGDPRWRTDRLQFRLTAVLGTGFGAGVALAASRLVAGAVPGSDIGGVVAGGLLGLLAATWVIGARGLLYRRAALDRWVGEVGVTLRACGEEMVTSRSLAAEIACVNE